MRPMDPSRKSFGLWLRRKRKDAGFSVKNIAQTMQCSTQRIKGIECGYDPLPMPWIFDLAKLYNVRFEEFTYRLEMAEPRLMKSFYTLDEKFSALFLARLNHGQPPSYTGLDG